MPSHGESAACDSFHGRRQAWSCVDSARVMVRKYFGDNPTCLFLALFYRPKTRLQRSWAYCLASGVPSPPRRLSWWMTGRSTTPWPFAPATASSVYLFLTLWVSGHQTACPGGERRSLGVHGWDAQHDPADIAHILEAGRGLRHGGRSP